MKMKKRFTKVAFILLGISTFFASYNLSEKVVRKKGKV